MNYSRLSNLAKHARHRVCASWTIPLLLLLAPPVTVQAQFNYIITNGTVTVTAYTGPGGAVTIPSTIEGLPVTGIGDGAFYSCTTLTSVIIPTSVTSIGFQAFAYCTSLTSVAIPTSVTSIGNQAFLSCTSLTSITIPNSVISIGDYTFSSCTNLTSVTIPNSVTSIGSFTFDECSSLPGVTIPPSVTSIGHRAFSLCTSLSNVTIPASVISIGDEAFAFCTSLSAINVDVLNTFYSSVDGVLLNKSQTTLIEYPSGRPGGYTIPSSVTSIGRGAFCGCSSLTSVTILTSVISIGDEAFSVCTSLTSVRIPNSVTSVGVMAFIHCTSLTNVTIPTSVTSIPFWAFSGCTNLSGVYFQGNAPTLGSQVFSGDNNATVYYLPGTTGWGPTFGGRPTAPWPPPAIQTPPQTQTAEMGANVTFGVCVTSPGDLPLHYQWFFNGTTRLSCTNSALQLTGVQNSQAGAYTAVVTNAAGSVTSPPAMLSVIASVERRMVPALTLMGQPGSILNLDSTASLGSARAWTTFDNVTLTSASQWYFDISLPTPSQRFYRAWQSGGGAPSALRLNFVPALTLTGAIGSSQRVDYINQFGPIDAWVTNLATVTLTNTAQLYFDTSVIGQPSRLYRIVPVP